MKSGYVTLSVPHVKKLQAHSSISCQTAVCHMTGIPNICVPGWTKRPGQKISCFMQAPCNNYVVSCVVTHNTIGKHNSSGNTVCSIGGDIIINLPQDSIDLIHYHDTSCLQVTFES